MTTEGQHGVQTHEGLGATLRGLREAHGWSVADVSERVKFAPRQIEALEAERFDQLPPGSVLRGLLRSYARILETDAERLLALLDAVHAPEPMRMPPPSLAAPLRQRPPASIFGGGRSTKLFVGLVIAALAVLAGAGWLTMNAQDWRRSVALPAGTVVEQAPMRRSSEAGNGPSQPVRAPAPAPAPEAAAPAAAVPTAGAVSPVAGGVPQAMQPVSPAAAAVGGAALSGSGHAAANPSAPHAIRLNFKDASWVEVRQRNGHVLFSQLSPAASEKTVSGEPPFKVVIGNAQAVRLEYKGEQVDLRPLTNRDNVARVTLE